MLGSSDALPWEIQLFTYGACLRGAILFVVKVYFHITVHPTVHMASHCLLPSTPTGGGITSTRMNNNKHICF